MSPLKLALTGILMLSSAAVASQTSATAQSLTTPKSTATADFTATVGSTQAAATVPKSAARRFSWGTAVSRDEFNYTGAPNPTLWKVYNSSGHGGHGLRRPSAWSVNGSYATVTGNSKGTTGGMSANYAQKYGRWEVRMRTNKRDSEYHSILMLWPAGTTRWSTCPEVDFAESTKDVTKIKFFLHYGCAPDQTRAVRTIDTTQWHNYAVEWTSTHITGYIDGVQYFKDTNKRHLPPGAMHQTIQEDWFPDGTTTRTSTMSIDWARVYKLG